MHGRDAAAADPPRRACRPFTGAGPGNDHGSWLNVADVQLNLAFRQCLNRRIDSIDVLRDEVAAWQAARDRLRAKVNWQSTTNDAHVKLKRLYPTFDA